jgi:hypothetical protein
LNKEDFKLPFSFIYGENDWVLNIDDGASLRLVDIKKDTFEK